MYKIQKIADAATSSASSDTVSIAGKKKVTFVCERTAHTAGTSTFKIQVRAKDENGNYSSWIDYDRGIVNIANTNGQTITRSLVAITLSAAGVDFMSLSPEDAFTEAKVVHTIATDGANTVWAITD